MSLYKLALAAGLGMIATSASALTVSPTGDANTLTNTFLGSSSGLTLVGAPTYVGANVQAGAYTGFNTVGLGNLGDGIVLSSGYAGDVPLSNTDTSWDHGTLGQPSPESLPGGSSDDADLVDILTSHGNVQAVNDVAYLEFSFTLDDPAQNAVAASFVFGTEEFPDQSVTDIFAFIVDGVNYAFFPDGSLINFDLGGASAGFYNSNLTNSYAIEWDGLTDILSITGLIDTTLSTHTLKIAIADTSDTIFDSAVYLSSLSGTTSTGGGGIDHPPSAVPVPASAPLILAGLAAFGFLRRRKAA